MNDPRLPSLPPDAPDWLRQYNERLTDLFRAMQPAAGWQDMIGSLNSAKVTGASQPTWAVVTDSIYAYKFAAGSTNEVWLQFHIPHDIATTLTREDGTVQAMTLYPHVHWMSDGTNTGTARFGIEYSYASGYSADVFPASTTIYLEQASDGVAKTHNITETTDDNAIVSADFETDGLLLVRLFRDGGHANDTLTDDVWIPFMDIHYFSDGLLTNERNRNSSGLPWTKNQQFES